MKVICEKVPSIPLDRQPHKAMGKILNFSILMENPKSYLGGWLEGKVSQWLYRVVFLTARPPKKTKKKQARKLQDAQAEKLTSLQANKLTTW